MISMVLLNVGFPLPVSAHREDELASVTLEDARVLKIGEYLSKVDFHGFDSEHTNYWRAKTVLLLLRLNVNESYQAISERIGTMDAQHAFAVKLGVESVLSVDSARRLIESFGEDLAREFLCRCILSNPGPAYCADIVCRVNRCESFSPWLRQYLLAKMKFEV